MLFDEERKKIHVGDIIIFRNNNSDEKISVRVTDLLIYPTFWELVAELDIEELADESMTKGEYLEVLDGLYSEEKQNKYSVVGIRFELV